MKDGSSNSHSSDVEYLESKNFLTWLSELEEQDELTTVSLSLLKGENRIKLIAANKAQIELEVQIDQGDFEKLGW